MIMYESVVSRSNIKSCSLGFPVTSKVVLLSFGFKVDVLEFWELSVDV